MNAITTEKRRTRGDGMETQDIAPKVECTDQQSIGKFDAKNELSLSNRINVQRKSRQETAHNRKTSAANGSLAPLPGLHALYRRQETVTRTLAPVIPKGELVPMTPRLIKSVAATVDHKKTKPPKFVPYEPYPGAVNPIMPSNKNGEEKTNKGIKVNKNNLDIGVLVRQMSTMRTQEMGEEHNEVDSNKQNTNADEVQNLKQELKKAQEERNYYQSQFKFQTQVNSELKNLLVASVGEDLQTRVNVLTEDKLQLARALLDTANNLTTHSEQIEFLAGQCEVWRSKFLASSVMVEELARWKADLTQKNQMLSESTKQLLHATHQLREMQLEMLKNLKFLAKIRYLNIPSTDVISLGVENLNILQQMVLHTGVGIPEDKIGISTASSNPLCDAEKYAVQALEFISQPLMATDAAIRALFDQAQRPYAGNVSSTVAVTTTEDSSPNHGNK